MIKINILFPNEKKRIIKKISKRIVEVYNKDIKSYKFNHVGDEKCYLYVYLEDDTCLFINVGYLDIENSMIICNDLSF